MSGEVKFCNGCQSIKSIDDFAFSRAPRRQSRCRACYATTYSATLAAKRRAARLGEMRQCHRCHATEDLVKMRPSVTAPVTNPRTGQPYSDRHASFLAARVMSNMPLDPRVVCRPCRDEIGRERARDRKRAYKQADPERTKAQTRAYQQRRRDHIRARVRKWRYGIMPEAFDELVERQEGGCAICRVDLSTLKPNCVHVDHDHDAGVVRGILCPTCNHAIGALRDDPDLMRRAASYVESRGWTSLRASA